MVATPLLILLAWFKGEGLRCALAVGLGLIAVYLLHKGISAISFETRPFVEYHFKPLYPHSIATSFPSSTVAYFAVATVPLLYVGRKLGWLMVGLTTEIAFGCVYVGVHYVTDVVAGAAVGAGCSELAWIALRHAPVSRVVVQIDDLLRKAHLRTDAGVQLTGTQSP
jgi:membrane-associated phospholipid phosphatase